MRPLLARLLLACVAPLCLGAKPNVILITADTLRADHLGTYGYFRPTSPSIDALAADGLVFDRAYVPMSTTLPSHTSLFTSAYPSRHGIVSNLRFFKQPVVTSSDLRTAAQRFKAAGYTTAGFTSASPLSEASGIHAGFDTFVGPPPYDASDERIEIKAEDTTKSALLWLLTARAPYFLWVHYFDPHDPYRPPHPHDRAFGPEPELQKRFERLAFPPAVWQRATLDTNQYDGEIQYMDAQIGRLLDHLKKYGQYDDALVIFTADHGEGLGQHDWQYHGQLWNELVQAPLIFKFPRSDTAPKGRSDKLASLIDVLPTAIEGAALPLSREGMDGVDLLEEERTSALGHRSERETPLWTGKLYTLTEREWKYYLHTDAEDELYKVSEDPHELRNVISKHPDVAERLRNETVRQLEANRARSPLEVKSELPDVIREQLRKLGYAE